MTNTDTERAALDAHLDALEAHARQGGTWDTRPLFVHPARQLPGAEVEDARRRLDAWHAWLATNPEGRI